MHGCPPYGPAVYDEESYNQDGYHRTTGRNREGRTRSEQAQADQADDGDSDDEHEEHDEEDEDGEVLEFHPVLQHVGADLRAAFAALTHDEREMFLVNLQIELFEERGITFGDPEESDEDDDGDGEEVDESSDGSSESDDGERLDSLGEARDVGENEVEQSSGVEQDQRINENGPTFASTTQEVHGALDAASRGEDNESWSTTSGDGDQPSTPMDIDPVNGQEIEEREPWKGPPGGWPIDEEL